MNKIIDSISGKDLHAYQIVLEKIYNSEFLQDKEREVVYMCMEFFEKNDRYPTRDFILETTNLEGLVESAPFEPSELWHYWIEKEKKRSAIRTGHLLVEASNAIMSGQDFDSVKKDLEQAFKVHTSEKPINEVSMADINLSSEIGKRESTVSFGIEEFDEVVKGIEPGTAVIIAGYVGSFKTSGAISMCNHNALQGHSTSILTLEMPARALKAQAVSNMSYRPEFPESPIAYQDILKGTLTPDNKDNLEKVEELIRDMEGRIDIFGASDVKGPLLTAMPKACEYLADKGTKAIFIDHIQLLKYYVPSSRDVEGVNNFIKAMTDVSVSLADRGYDFRVIFLSQIGRDAYKKALRRGGAYDLTCLAEYNELERSASYIVTNFATDELKAVNELRVQLIKHRLGATVEDPVSIFVDPAYSMVGGISAMSTFDPNASAVSELLDDDFEF